MRQRQAMAVQVHNTLMVPRDGTGIPFGRREDVLRRPSLQLSPPVPDRPLLIRNLVEEVRQVVASLPTIASTDQRARLESAPGSNSHNVDFWGVPTTCTLEEVRIGRG